MFYVMEIQTQFDGASTYLVHTEATSAGAEHKYHEVLSYAAISELAKHSACIIDDAGNLVKNDGYFRDPPVEE